MVLINRDNLTARAVLRRRAKGGRYPPFVKASTKSALAKAAERPKRINGIYSVNGIRMPGNTANYTATYQVTGDMLEITGESHAGKHQMVIAIANRSEIVLFELAELFLQNMDHYSGQPSNGQSVSDYVEHDYSKRPRRWAMRRQIAPVTVKRFSGRGTVLPIRIAYQPSFLDRLEDFDDEGNEEDNEFIRN